MTRASFYFVLALSVIFSLSAFAGLKKLQPKYVDVRSKIDDYNTFLANRPKSVNESKGSGVKPFRRLEWYLESRLMPDGTFPAGGRWNAYLDEVTSKPSSNATT